MKLEMSKQSSDTIAERRLRPIYDWLDNGNNKKAIQEADKVLKKQPELLCAQVLKGLALLRLGKNKDCESILETVHKKMPADDCTLQALTICYREIHQLEKICDMYEKALLKDPSNEELHTHLFMAYVRIGDYKKQQQVALNLYKVKPKNPYYFWGVMSIVMQAQASEEKISKNVMLPLAERMIGKFINDGKIEAEQEIQLYIMILEMQEKYQEALDVIDSELGQKIISDYSLPRRRIKLLHSLGKWRELNSCIKKKISEQPDSYDDYRLYFHSVFELMNGNEKNCSATLENGTSELKTCNSFNGDLLTPDDNIESCVNFVRKCQESEISSYKLRGPHLALLLLYEKLLERGYDPVKYLGNLLNLFVKYFQLFADKACCFKDLHKFLPMIQNDCVSLLTSTWNLIDEINDGGAKNKKQIMMSLTHFQITRYFGIYELFSVNEKLNNISQLLDFYYDGRQFNANTTPTDLGCSDVFMILVTHFLHDLYLETQDFKFIKDAICLLEYSYKYSPSNHHFKLLLLRFYNMLGASKASYEYFYSLEIKHMQYDSLGYLECWSLLCCGQYTRAIHLLDYTLKFFTINCKEATDQLTHAYKYGSFEMVNEFLNFKEKLKNSFHYRLVYIEHTIYELIHLSNPGTPLQNTTPTLRTIADMDISLLDNFENLVDNRDTTLFLSFDPEVRRMNDEYTKLSFEHEIKLIRLRTLMLRCIEFSLNICSTNPINPNSITVPEKSDLLKNDVFNHLNLSCCSQFKSTIQELCDMFESISKNSIEEIPKNILSGVEPSRIFLYSNSFFIPLFIDTMLFLHEACNFFLIKDFTELKLTEMAESCATTFTKVITESNENLASMRKGQCGMKYRDLFEHLSLVVEMISILSLMCGNLHSLFIASNKKNTPSKRKKKLGKESSTKTSFTSNIVEKNSIKQELEENILKTVSNYVHSTQSSIETLKTSLLKSVSNWFPLENHEPEFKLHQQKSQVDDLQVVETMKITSEEWSKLQSDVNNNLEESYRSSMEEFSNIITQKLEYLSLLSF